MTNEEIAVTNYERAAAAEATGQGIRRAHQTDPKVHPSPGITPRFDMSGSAIADVIVNTKAGAGRPDGHADGVPGVDR